MTEENKTERTKELNDYLAPFEGKTVFVSVKLLLSPNFDGPRITYQSTGRLSRCQDDNQAWFVVGSGKDFVSLPHSGTISIINGNIYIESPLFDMVEQKISKKDKGGD